MTRLAGWYVPAANGIGPEGPTIVLVHGYAANKSDILAYGAGLHETFKLAAFDLRNGGRSSGTRRNARWRYDRNFASTRSTGQFSPSSSVTRG